MKKEVLFYFEGVDRPDFFDETIALKWLDSIALHYNKKIGVISFKFCDDDAILDCNKQFLNHDYYTDVITFDYCRNNFLCGDIVISLDTVKSNAEKFDVSYQAEFNRVLCHPILHLIGFKDKTDIDAPIMRQNENTCLELLKLL